MTVSPDEDKAGVQFLVSELAHEAIALVSGPPTTLDWTVVDGESGLCEDGALEWTALDMPIPDQTALDDETFAHAVAIAGALAAVDDGAGQTVQGPPSGCQRRSKISPPGRSKTSPLNVMRYAVLGGCPGSP